MAKFKLRNVPGGKKCRSKRLKKKRDKYLDEIARIISEPLKSPQSYLPYGLFFSDYIRNEDDQKAYFDARPPRKR